MKFYKIISVILAVLMLSSVLFACTNQPGDPQDETQEQTSATTDGSASITDSITDGQTELATDALGDNLNFGTDITILYWEDVERQEFEETEKSGDIINDAIISRNTHTKERLGIDINWIHRAGNYNNQQPFVQYVINDVQNDHAIDIIAGYSLTGSTLAVNGCSSNLLNTEYLNLDSPWWPATLTQTASINNKLFFCSGDISTNFLHMMYAVVYNKDLFDLYHSEVDVYSLVENKQWTIDKMFSLCENVYSDENGTTIKDYGDLYGFMTIDLHFDAFFSGADLHSVQKSAAGELEASLEFTSEKAQNLLVKVNNYLHNSGFSYAKGTTAKDSSAAALRDGLAMFVIDRVYITSGTLKDVKDFDIGVLPIPMFDEAQTKYITCMAFPFTLYSISSQSAHKAAASAVLECMGSESYRYVTPALFETSMKLRYVDGEEDAKMFDLIRDSVQIDLGRIFCTEYSNVTYSTFRNAVKNNSQSWTTLSNPAVNILNRANTTINKAIQALSDN